MYKFIIKIIAVIMISILFIDSGYDKIVNFGKVSEGLQTKMLFNLLPLFISQLSIIITILLELISPLLLLYGVITNNNKYIIAGTLGLIIFTTLATIFYHPLPKQKNAFMKNMSIVGALLFITAN